MSSSLAKFIDQHDSLTRRYFLKCGAAGAVALNALPLLAESQERNAQLQKAIDKLETWLTSQNNFRDVSRGKPTPHKLPLEKKKQVGMTRETWKLEVVADPDNPARIRKPFTQEKNTALDFQQLMKLAEKHAVRFPKVMTCLNIGCPLGTGIWEGVPLRTVIWMTQPTENLRRVFYDGYHNDDPKQLFRSSMPIGRILEDPYDLPPVILCYKLNGDWLTSERGGPVRLVVPEAYGFKSIKWLTHIFLSNHAFANDTYAGGNNDVDSPLKTWAATLSVPVEAKANQPLPITGYAQVGISGLKKVQVWIHNEKEDLPKGDKHFTQAPWQDAEILGPPESWGGDLPDDKIPTPTHGFDEQTGQPTSWPMRLTKIHWAALLPGLPPGDYTLRSRTIDEKGAAQPLPRPFRKSGHAAIEQVGITVS